MSGRSGSVLIVGAGVGGLAASTLLAQHGVSSLLVEKRREIFVYPKARNLTFRGSSPRTWERGDRATRLGL